MRPSDSGTSAFHIPAGCLSPGSLAFRFLYFPQAFRLHGLNLWETVFLRLWSCQQGEAKIIHKAGHLHLIQITAALPFQRRRNSWFLFSGCCASWICFFLHSMKLRVFMTMRDKELLRSNSCWPLPAASALRKPSQAWGKWEGKNRVQFTPQSVGGSAFYHIALILSDFSSKQPRGGVCVIPFRSKRDGYRPCQTHSLSETHLEWNPLP